MSQVHFSLQTSPRPLLSEYSGCVHVVVVVVQSLSRVRLFVTPWTAARQASLSFTISQSFLKFMSIESVMPPNHLIHCRPPSPPAFNLSRHQGLFPMSQLFPSGGHSIGASASASVLPMNIQGWFPLGLTGLISCVHGTLLTSLGAPKRMPAVSGWS